MLQKAASTHRRTRRDKRQRPAEHANELHDANTRTYKAEQGGTSRVSDRMISINMVTGRRRPCGQLLIGRRAGLNGASRREQKLMMNGRPFFIGRPLRADRRPEWTAASVPARHSNCKITSRRATSRLDLVSRGASGRLSGRRNELQGRSRHHRLPGFPISSRILELQASAVLSLAGWHGAPSRTPARVGRLNDLEE
jgi:hypothetical protein